MPDSQRAWNARRYLNDQGFAILDSLETTARYIALAKQAQRKALQEHAL